MGISTEKLGLFVLIIMVSSLLSTGIFLINPVNEVKAQANKPALANSTQSCPSGHIANSAIDTAASLVPGGAIVTGLLNVASPQVANELNNGLCKPTLANSTQSCPSGHIANSAIDAAASLVPGGELVKSAIGKISVPQAANSINNALCK